MLKAASQKAFLTWRSLLLYLNWNQNFLCSNFHFTDEETGLQEAVMCTGYIASIQANVEKISGPGLSLIFLMRKWDSGKGKGDLVQGQQVCPGVMQSSALVCSLHCLLLCFLSKAFQAYHQLLWLLKVYDTGAGGCIPSQMIFKTWEKASPGDERWWLEELREDETYVFKH